MIKRLFIYSLSAFAFLTSCKSDDTDTSIIANSQIIFAPTVDNSTYSFNNIITLPNGISMKYESLKFYVSNVKLVGSNGVETNVKSVELIDLMTAGKESFSIKLESGPYEKIKFGLGLSPDINNTDPTTIPIEHPLGAAGNMYWTWGSQYKFMTLTGTFSTTSSTDLTEAFVWHPGRDQLYKEVELNLNQKHFYDDTKLTINLDIKGLMTRIETVDIPNESTWHGDLNEIATPQKIVDNFAASLSIKN